MKEQALRVYLASGSSNIAARFMVDCGDEGAGTEPARYGAPLVLVRPDQFVAWTGQAGGPAVTAEQAREVLTRVAG